MQRRARISIVTPYLEPERALAETMASVAGQGDLDLEHIVVAAADMPARPTWHAGVKTLVSDPARGRVGAVNAGLRLATGDVRGVVDAGDRLLPGALARVIGELDPARGRHVVLGRCSLMDDGGRPAGIERASDFEGHRRVLEIWRGPTVAPPAVFWTAAAWTACGPMDERLPPAWADYDFACRLLRASGAHRVDQVLAAARLEPEASAARWSRDEDLERGIAVSRRYWGSPLRPLYWRLALSLAHHRLDRIGRARRHVRRAQVARRSGAGTLEILCHAVAAVLLAPAVAFYVGAYPALRARAARPWQRALDHLGQRGSVSSATATYLDQTEAWGDGWVGPRLAITREIAHHAQAVDVAGWVDLQHFTRPLVLTVRLDGRLIGRHRVRQPGDFVARIPVKPPAPPGTHTVDVEASTWFVPDSHTGSGDLRPLAWRLGRVDLDGAAGG